MYCSMGTTLGATDVIELGRAGVSEGEAICYMIYGYLQQLVDWNTTRTVFTLFTAQKCHAQLPVYIIIRYYNTIILLSPVLNANIWS